MRSTKFRFEEGEEGHCMAVKSTTPYTLPPTFLLPAFTLPRLTLSSRTLARCAAARRATLERCEAGVGLMSEWEERVRMCVWSCGGCKGRGGGEERKERKEGEVSWKKRRRSRRRSRRRTRTRTGERREGESKKRRKRTNLFQRVDQVGLLRTVAHTA